MFLLAHAANGLCTSTNTKGGLIVRSEAFAYIERMVGNIGDEILMEMLGTNDIETLRNSGGRNSYDH